MLLRFNFVKSHLFSSVGELSFIGCASLVYGVEAVLSIVCPFNHAIIRKRGEHFLRQFFTRSKVDDFNRRIVDGVPEQQYFKLLGFAVAIHTAFRQIDVGVRFDIDLQGS